MTQPYRVAEGVATSSFMYVMWKHGDHCARLHGPSGCPGHCAARIKFLPIASRGRLPLLAFRHITFSWNLSCSGGILWVRYVSSIFQKRTGETPMAPPVPVLWVVIACCRQALRQGIYLPTASRSVHRAASPLRRLPRASMSNATIRSGRRLRLAAAGTPRLRRRPS